MDAQTAATASALAQVTAHTADIVSIHSYINHGLLLLVVSLLGIIAWFFRGTLCRIEKGIEKKADKEQNKEEHDALFAHYHGIDCSIPECTRKTGDLVVPHQVPQ